MDGSKWVSIWRAALTVGGYPELVWNVARAAEFETRAVPGVGRQVRVDDLDAIGVRVRAWLDRPRMFGTKNPRFPRKTA